MSQHKDLIVIFVGDCGLLRWANIVLMLVVIRISRVFMKLFLKYGELLELTITTYLQMFHIMIVLMILK